MDNMLAEHATIESFRLLRQHTKDDVSAAILTLASHLWDKQVDLDDLSASVSQVSISLDHIADKLEQS